MKRLRVQLIRKDLQEDCHFLLRIMSVLTMLSPVGDVSVPLSSWFVERRQPQYRSTTKKVVSTDSRYRCHIAWRMSRLKFPIMSGPCRALDNAIVMHIL